MSLKAILEIAAKHYGDKTAIVLGDRRLSYAELDEASNKVANALTKIGVGRGDRVAMLLPNSLEFVVICFGITKIGAVAVPLDTKYKFGELASLFDDSQPRVLVSESPFLEPLVPILPTFKYMECVIDAGAQCDGQFLSYQEIVATSSARKVKVEPEPEDTASIVYTSGPAFRPRGVMLSHQDLVTEAVISGDGFQQTDEDVVVLFALPMHHVVGLVIVLLTSITKGSTVVMLPGLSISGLMEIIEKEKATIFTGVPFVFALMVHMAGEEGIGHDLSSLRLCSVGGAPIPIEVMKRFKQLYGLDVVQWWGLTEATAHVTCQPVDGTGKLGSVGKALPGWEVKIVDARDRELPINHTGEIIVSGPVMKGYYNNPLATAETMKNGWLYTGDIGRIDEDGELFILGRKKELIIAKGQNIYPSDIEDVLYTHPKVAEVAVVGIPGELRGEVVKAVVSLKEGEVATEQEIKRFCLERLANYKVPKQVIFLDSLPKTAAGKICKEDLKK
ncbi:class I adenylate-forming enzyme family protein [Chloroflexota bacterium]